MPVLGLDLDDTVMPYLTGLRDFIIQEEAEFFKGMSSQEIASHFPDLDTYNSFPWTLINGDRAKFEYYHEKAVDAGLLRNQVAYPHASETLHRLVEEHDIQVYIITSRFVVKGQHNKVLSDTGYALDANNIPYRDIMFVRRKVDVVADVYMDDAPHNLLSLQEAGRNTITFHQSYNQEVPGLRVSGWEEAYPTILQSLNLT